MKVNTTLRAISASTIHKYAQEGTEFDASELRGRIDQQETGWLDEEWTKRYKADKPSYTVLSFYTPIAWRAGGRWVVADQHFSSRTSRHQGIVRGLV